MKYAVIQSGSRQFKVQEGDVVLVDQLALQKDAPVTFQNVLLFVSDNPAAVMVGNPYVANIAVTGKVLGPQKGEKIRVSQFKAKVRRRRVVGHRAKLTQVQIATIVQNSQKEAPSVTKKTVKAKTTRAKKAV